MAKQFRVIVCGGRKYFNFEAINRALNELHENDERGPIYAVIHGNAAGADRLGRVWAIRNKVRCWPVPAEWSKYGNAAGPIRNKKMLGMGPSVVVAFPGGKGTRNMMKQARAAGIEVIEITPP